MENENIIIKGAKENNLKNIDLTIPRNKLVVFSGVSGCGKSTLAFDTIFAEGQRRYIESLSSYARMFLGQAEKPNVESIEGLSPAISIDQKSTNHNPRSTVGTVTEIYDYLRLLYSRVGTPYCPNCHKKITQMSIDQIIDEIKKIPNGEKFMVLSPIIRGQKGTHANTFEHLKKDGFARVRVDGVSQSLDDEITLDKNKKHNIDVIVDRLIMDEEIMSRLTSSVELAIKTSEGKVIITSGENDKLYSTLYSCDICGHTISELTPRLFSFNNPVGACSNCGGLGFLMDIDENKVLKNRTMSIREGAFAYCGYSLQKNKMAQMYFEALAKKYGINLDIPLKDMPREHLDIVLYGNNDEKLDMRFKGSKLDGTYFTSFEGVITNMRRRYKETQSSFMREEIGRYMSESFCPVCKGQRLNAEALSVLIDGKNILDVCEEPVHKLLDYYANLTFAKKDEEIAKPIMKEIKARLTFLRDVGLGYLTLNRGSATLSGGESQRIRLATQIGSGLAGVLYILDEPSIGLHQSDNEKLLGTLKHLRDLGNTLIVVEHDEDTIRAADYIVDIGPFAGEHGGSIVAAGSLADIMASNQSITGAFLRGDEKIEIRQEYRKLTGDCIEIHGACKNNLKNVDVKIPCGVFTCITGVSGSGKSSLMNETLLPYLEDSLNKKEIDFRDYKVKSITTSKIDKVVNIDQSPIGRTPRSNPATYVGLFSDIRELFASTKDAKERGYTASRFSFNVGGGRCEHCEGDGTQKIEMYFLPDVYVECDVCKGKRYNRETLEVKYKGKNIADVLNMTVETALAFFENIPKLKNKLQAMMDVGLGYVRLGQSSTTLSGGEAQRVKLATHLAKRAIGHTMYMLDEPTTGLHMYDVKKLIAIFQTLVEKGNTVLVIEHNLDVIKSADYIIDIGPNGGDEGGEIVATGTPIEVATNKNSKTGKYLTKILIK